MRAVVFGGWLVLVGVASSDGRGQAPVPPYKAPVATGPVVELIDENVEPIFIRLNNDGKGEAGTIAREDRDVFAGVEAVRVTPLQKFSQRILGWTFRVVEKPARTREYRYLRFAWKKVGGTGIMVQLHTPTNTWDQRFYAGKNVFGWAPAKQVADKLPADWEVVTIDLFKEFGTRIVTGIALAPLDGDYALFDHVVMGRTIEDLDRATNEALGKRKLAKPLEGKDREAYWRDLTGTDSAKAAVAIRDFLATAEDHTAFIRDQLAKVPAAADARRVRKLIGDLNAEPFDVREAATDELIKIGPGAIDAVRDAGSSATNDEVRFRCRVILKKLGGGTELDRVGKAGRLSRAVRVLERAATPEARGLLADIADGKLAPEVAPDAKAALARLPKP